MNEDRLDGAATNMGGKVKDAVGGLMGDSKMQAEGKADQVSGRVQNAYGTVKDEAADMAGNLGSQIESLVKEQPVLMLLGAVGVGYILRMLTSDRG